MIRLLLSAALFLPGLVIAAPPRFEPVQLAGMNMQLPVGWQRQQDDASVILTDDPKAEHPAVTGLIAVASGSTDAVAPDQVADLVLQQMDLPSHGFRVSTVELRRKEQALYRLHQLDTGSVRGYLASFTFTESTSGAIVHMFFSALDQRFVDLGGPLFPLVVFGGMEVSALEQAQKDATQTASQDVDSCDGSSSLEVCLADKWLSPGGRYALPNPGGSSGGSSPIIDSYTATCDRAKAAARSAVEMQQAELSCQRLYVTASQMLRMNHQASMRILGRCYIGDPGCE